MTASGRTRAWWWSAGAVAALVMTPHLSRLAWPSLYGDDAVRIAQIRTWPLVEVLRRPFNEHLAPVHGLITWIAWSLCDGRLTAAPLAFSAASLLALPAALAALGWAVGRRTHRRDLALSSVALGGLSWLFPEVVGHYSASGFAWALAAAFLAFGAASATGRGRYCALAASALAPACSAIGILAGPLGAVGGWFGGVSDGSNRSLSEKARAAAWPLAGLGLYLAVASLAQYGETVARGLGRRIAWEPGILAAGRAVWNVLPMAMVGGRPWWTGLLSWADAALAAALVAGIGLVAWRTRQWALAVGGLVLVAGGYGLTYPVRYEGSAEWLLRVDRYHLFPHFGFVLWVVMVPAIFRGTKSEGWRGLSESSSVPPDRRPPRIIPWTRSMMPPWRAEWTGPLVAMVLLALNGPRLVERLRAYSFPEQPKVLAALDRLERICAQEGITREQALRALEPIRTSWLHPERNGLTAPEMLGPTGVASPRLADAAVRERLLTRLSPSDRAALWGGMDVTPYVKRHSGEDHVVEEGRVGPVVGLRGLGSGRYRGRGWPSYVEYVIEPASAEPASGLRLGVRISGDGTSSTKLPPVEIWWSDHAHEWSETQRVTWRPDRDGVGVVPLESMPHWSLNAVRRVRIAVRTAGEVEIDTPQLVR